VKFHIKIPNGFWKSSKKL